MKIAVVADWLTTYGGAEHVLRSMHELWPSAPLFTTVTRRGDIGPLSSADIRPCLWLQSLFRLIRNHRVLLPLLPWAVESIDLEGYDIVLSSSHAVAKGVIPPSTAVHICYCHTPMRYAWEMEKEYLSDFKIRWPLKTIVQRQLKKLRRWDLSTVRRVDAFIANSSETQKRIRETYGRDSVIIPPPVEDRFFETPLEEGAYFLALGRLVPYKRFDLLIEAANTLKVPLKIGGMGSEYHRLRRLAGPTVELLGFVPDEALPRLYSRASALLFPQVEDAGIVPLEALASGVPVIAYAKGGALDVVTHGKTGILVDEQSTQGFMRAMQAFQRLSFDRSAIRNCARIFHVSEFKRRLQTFLKEASRRMV